MTARHLNRPLLGRAEPQATGERIQTGEVEIPASLIGLAAVEDGRLSRPSSVREAAGDDAKRNVRRVERVMTERREDDGGGGRAMHERDWAEGRLANRRGGN